MRSGILDGVLSVELTGAKVAGKEMERRAAAMTETDVHEAARLWFAAGEIHSSAAHRFAATETLRPRGEAIRCYRTAATAAPPPPHPLLFLCSLRISTTTDKSWLRWTH